MPILPQPRRGRPPFPRELVLAAAAELFAAADPSGTVSMDEIAAAAGVGKGTLFRAFDSRAGLIEAVFEMRITSFREDAEHGSGPLGPATPPEERLLAILDALLSFKLANAQLIRARELSATELVSHGFYRWIHGLLSTLILEMAPDAGVGVAAYAAHALLGTQRPDVTERLQAEQGMTREDLRRAQAALVRMIIAGDGPRT